MPDNNYNDRGLAIFFGVIGVIGIYPALYGLSFTGYLTWSSVKTLASGTSIPFQTLPLALAFIAVMLFGFWLLLQYARRAFGKDASVPPGTLWKLSTGQNMLYAIVALGALISELHADLPTNATSFLRSSAPFLWFSMLTALSARGIPKEESPGDREPRNPGA